MKTSSSASATATPTADSSESSSSSSHNLLRILLPALLGSLIGILLLVFVSFIKLLMIIINLISNTKINSRQRYTSSDQRLVVKHRTLVLTAGQTVTVILGLCGRISMARNLEKLSNLSVDINVKVGTGLIYHSYSVWSKVIGVISLFGEFVRYSVFANLLCFCFVFL